METLFVYGSLQPGGSNEHVLAGIEGEWQPATIKGRLVEAGWGAGIGYPGLMIEESGEDVRGYVLHSSGLSARWPQLDRFEGPAYERTVASVTLANGEVVEAHVYVIRVPDG